VTLTDFQAWTLERALLDTTTAGGLLDATVDLYQTPIAVTPETPLATFTAAVATFTGYAQGVVTWELPTVADDGEVEVIGTLPIWRPTDGVTPNQIYGMFIRLDVGGSLAMAGQFDTPPLPMISALDSIICTLRYRPASGTLVVTVS